MAADQMSPDATPAGPGSGTRRVNSVPVYIAAGVIVVFLTTIAIVASNRAEQQNAPPPPKVEKASSSTMFANEIAAGQLDGVIPAKVAPPEAPAEPVLSAPMGAPIGIEQVPPLRPMGGSGPSAPMMTQTDPSERAAADERRQRAEAAMKAKSGVQFMPALRGANGDLALSAPPANASEALARIAALRQQASAGNTGDVMAAYNARTSAVEAALKGRGIIGGSSANGSSLSAGTGDFIQASANGAGQDRWKLDSGVERPRSKYELRAGFVIPATLIGGINSELPGQIVAQVSQHVWDTATGKHLLIPQGSRLVGSYNNAVLFGQSRVLVAWQRIVFPDGKAMDIGAMPGADSAGYAGFSDQVNNHYVRIFGSALLMSGVIAGVTYSQGSAGSSSTASAPTASSAMSEALGQQLGQATSQLISKNLNIAPTLEIRPGYRFNVVAVKDLTFTKPYRSFDY